MPTVHKSKTPLKKIQCAAKQTTHLYAINRGVTKHQACIQAALEPHAATRINRLLDKTCSLRDVPLSGRPDLHTDQVMQDVKAVCAKSTCMRKRATAIVPRLLQCCILYQGATKAEFMHACHKYCHRQHNRLTAAGTSDCFFLKPEDKSERVHYTKQMLKYLVNWDAWWAVLFGELTLEKDLHPKSGV